MVTYRKKLMGWAQRKGLSEEQAEDFADYYENPGGWYGDKAGHREAAMKGFSKRKGINASSSEMESAAENAFFGESVRHRIAALKKWAKEKGISGADAQEFAQYVENSWYGDPEDHRRAALTGWRKRRSMENPWIKPILPEPYRTYLGVVDMKADLSHGIGIAIGVPTSFMYAGIGELGFGDQWAGTVVGLGAGLATSEAIRRWMPTKAVTDEEEAEIRSSVARGYRIGTYGLTVARIIRTIIMTATGTKTSSAMGQGLEDLMEKIKEGKIIEAIKLPVVAGLGLDSDYAGALGQLKIKLPELPESIMKLLPKKKSEEVPSETTMSADENVAISAQDDELPAITQEDENVAISAQDSPATSIAIS